MEIVYGTIIAVKLQDSLLLLRRAKKETDAGMWEFPTGTFEKSDQTIYDTAVRELREETGLEAKRLHYLGDMQRRDGERLYYGYAYLAEEVAGKLKLSEEHDDYRWVSRDELADYMLDRNTELLLRLYEV